MVCRRGLLGSAYRRASAVSAGLRESRERLQDSSFRLRSHFRDRRGREDELSAPFFLPHDRHHALGDKAVVEIVFRLIDNKRGFRFQQQQQ